LDNIRMFDWGDVPTWLSTVSSLLALIFAAVAVILARRTFDIESRRDQATALDRRAQNARERQSLATLVSAWWGTSTSSVGATEAGAFVRNGSGSPAYHAYLTVHAPVGAAEPETVKVRLPVIPPSDVADFHLVPGESAATTSVRASDRQVSLTFTDAAGVRWWRDRHGLLHELPSELMIWGTDRMEALLATFASDFQAMYGVRSRRRGPGSRAGAPNHDPVTNPCGGVVTPGAFASARLPEGG
jgi:arabinogalactan oligomer/maltooligosaccharide transport system substrate-binding protein